MDDAERWLREHDPDYTRTSEAWRHVRTGEYVQPWQEVPVGGGDDLSLLVAVGAGSYVDALGPRACEDLACGRAFHPSRDGERFCSDLCQKRAKRRERREESWRRCAECDVGFYAATPWQRFCSDRCSSRARQRSWRERRSA